MGKLENKSLLIRDESYLWRNNNSIDEEVEEKRKEKRIQEIKCWEINRFPMKERNEHFPDIPPRKKEVIDPRIEHMWYVIQGSEKSIISYIKSRYSILEIYEKEGNRNFYEYIDQRCIIIRSTKRNIHQFYRMISSWVSQGYCDRRDSYDKGISNSPRKIYLKRTSMYILSKVPPDEELKNTFLGIEFRVLYIN